jgi:hypothetical protein
MLDSQNILNFDNADIDVKWKQDQDYCYYRWNHMIKYKFVLWLTDYWSPIKLQVEIR